MSDLLPCPFCGGEAELLGPDNPAHEYWVVCKDRCGKLTTSKAQAIKDWNTRNDTRKAYRVEDMPQEHYEAIMNAEVPIECCPETNNTVIRELAEMLERAKNVTTYGELHDWLINADDALTKHADRIQQSKEQG